MSKIPKAEHILSGEEENRQFRRKEQRKKEIKERFLVMRMNKKLKNVLAFGLATSFVLTSTMGALATDNAGENEVAYGATADVTSYGVQLDVTYYYGTIAVGTDSMSTSINGPQTIHFTPSSMPKGYVLAEGNQLDFEATEFEWTADGSLYKNINIYVDKEPEQDVTVNVIVNFRDADTDTYVLDENGDYVTINKQYTFTPESGEQAEVSIDSTELPAGYEIAGKSTVTAYKDVATGYGTVDVKKKAEAKEATKKLNLAIADVTDGGYTALVNKVLSHTFEADSVATASYDFAEEINALIPGEYTVVKTEGDKVVYKVGDDETAYTVLVEKKAEAKEATKKLNLVIADVTDGGYKALVEKVLSHTFEADSVATASYDFEEEINALIPSDYTVDSTLGDKVVYKVGDDETAYTVYVVKKAEEETRTVNVYFYVDPEKGTLTKYAPSTVVSFENVPEFSDQQLEIPAVEAKEGYKFVGWKGYGAGAIEWSADAKTFGVTGLSFFAEGSNVGYASVEAVFEKVEEPTPETRTANVYFNVDPEKGFFPAYAPSTTVSFENLDEFSDQQFEIPAVEAKEGYKFVGWKGQGADVIEWSADAKTFGVTGLAFYEEGSNVGNASIEAVFEKVEEPAPETRTANVYFSVDPEKGSFPAYAPSTVVSFENLDEFSDQQFEIPAVEAKEGYKFVGWKGQGADVIEWDADATTFGVTGLAFFAEGSNVGYASVDAVFEKVEEPAPETRTVNVYFAVDPEKGSFPAYAPSTVVSFENLDEFSDQQFEIPAVEAKEGYKFVGWKGQGADVIEWDADAKTFGVTGLAFFEEGSNVGNASVEAVFEEVEPETETTTTETEPTTTEPTTEPTTTVEPTTTEPTTEEPTTGSEEETTEEATTEDETETEKKATVTEKNNKSDDNSNKTSDSAVKTGDTTTVMPYVIALFAAAALIVVLALKKRRTF